MPKNEGLFSKYHVRTPDEASLDMARRGWQGAVREIS